MHTELPIAAIRADFKLYFYLEELVRDCLKALHAPEDGGSIRFGHLSKGDVVAIREFCASQVDVVVCCGGIQNRISPKRRTTYNQVIRHLADSFSLPDTGRIRFHLADQLIAKVEFIQGKAQLAA